MRGGKSEFLYSRLMCWVAIDRGVRLATKRSFPAPVSEWIEQRNAIYAEIFSEFWSEKRQSFTQRKGAEALDASTLLMPLVRFISPTDPRWLSTLKAIEKELVEDSLVHRYKLNASAAPDGLEGTEGTFCMCTFWYAEALAGAGDVQQARYIFEKMLGYANHVGLYAEQLGPEGNHLGNFPQAFTHLGLISAAFSIDRALAKASAPAGRLDCYAEKLSPHEQCATAFGFVTLNPPFCKSSLKSSSEPLTKSALFGSTTRTPADSTMMSRLAGPSTRSIRYCSPEHPPPITATRSAPWGRPWRVRSDVSFVAAGSVTFTSFSLPIL